MRRYDDPVEVRRGICGSGEGAGEGPEQFLWRGRLWKVRAVVAHWVETGPWWNAPADASSPTTDLLAEREMWRVEAGRGLGEAMRSGVFDLSFSWTDGSWQLVGCSD